MMSFETAVDRSPVLLGILDRTAPVLVAAEEDLRRLAPVPVPTGRRAADLRRVSWRLDA